MITLYKIVPGPVGDCGIGGEVVLDEAWDYQWTMPRWWGDKASAGESMRTLARRVGLRPKPGLQNTDPLRFVVVEATFESVEDVANNRPLTIQEIDSAWLLASGFVTNRSPEEEVAQ